MEVDLTGADLLVDDFFCPTCGAQVFFVERADAYACPKCGGTHVGPHQGPAYW
ncbi:MAG: 30S ribosomal protein S27ae [Actinobacteria bacterium]|nr:30S ribosomal protein S27ae [Actinomycetota bacterium]